MLHVQQQGVSLQAAADVIEFLLDLQHRGRAGQSLLCSLKKNVSGSASPLEALAHSSMPFRPRYETPLERRRMRILSTFVRELEQRGFTVEQDRQHLWDIHVRHERDEVHFELAERIRQYRRERTEEEKADRFYRGRK